MIIIILLLSFYLEGAISSITTNFLIPLFTLISLIIIYPYLYNLKKDYYIICFIMGLLYDIAYTDTLFLNAIIFLFIGFIILKINIFFTNNIFNTILMSIIIISIYRIITYVFLGFINYINLDITDLIYSIKDSLIINIIYCIITFKISNYIANKKGIYKMN